MYGDDTELKLSRLDSISDLLEQFISAQVHLVNTPVSLPRQQLTCKEKPKGDELRMDIDAAYNESRGLFGVGFVIRNSDGKLKAIVSHRKRWSGDVRNAELQAVVSALRFCVKIGFHKVNVFSDSLLYVHAVAGQQVYLDSGVTISEAHKLMATEYFSCT